MNRWIFTGISDKRELLLYTSKLLAASGYRVLLIDATEQQKYSYSIGTIDSNLPLVEFCGFDIAIGFVTMGTLNHYLNEHEITIECYDYVLLDLERLSFTSVDIWLAANEVVWVTSFERFALERSVEGFERLFKKFPVLEGIKIRTMYVDSVESDLNCNESFIHTFVHKLPIIWHSNSITIPWNEMNYAIRLENEHYRTLSIRRLSRSYKRALTSLVADLTRWDRPAIKKALRVAERRQA